ncbi:MAG: DUF2380 domain-containing protein [Alphaproteobacteria bacterium]
MRKAARYAGFRVLYALFLPVLLCAAAPAWAGAGVPAGTAGSAAAGPQKLALFPFTFSAMAGAKPDPARDERLASMTAILRDAAAKSRRFALVPIPDPMQAPKGSAVSRLFPGCASCAIEAARELGADVAWIAEVQQVTAIMHSITVTAWDAKTGRELSESRADVRGDDDATWKKGVEWLIQNRLFK